MRRRVVGRIDPITLLILSCIQSMIIWLNSRQNIIPTYHSQDDVLTWKVIQCVMNITCPLEQHEKQDVRVCALEIYFMDRYDPFSAASQSNKIWINSYINVYQDHQRTPWMCEISGADGLTIKLMTGSLLFIFNVSYVYMTTNYWVSILEWSFHLCLL